MISSWLPMKTVDLGVPLLGMHSSRELMGTSDQEYLEKLIKGFFEL
jgi:aspartyl aminopeptidase